MNVLRTRWSRKSSGMSATKLASEFWKPNPLKSHRKYGFVIVTSAAPSELPTKSITAGTDSIFLISILLSSFFLSFI